MICDRIEDVAPQKADILSARALADLPTLLAFAQLHMAENGICLFQKGAKWEKEVRNAQETWNFDFETTRSLTDPEAVILKVGDLTRV